MQRSFAFLRAVNVGGHTVKMDVLRNLFEAQGFAGVETFLASGNVSFETAPTDAAALEADIEAMLHDALGYEVVTFLRTGAQLRTIVRRVEVHGEGRAPNHSMYVGFLRSTPPAAVRREVESSSNEVDQLRVEGRELYWRIAGKLMDSTVGADPRADVLGVMTTRNVTTVQRLAARYGLG